MRFPLKVTLFFVLFQQVAFSQSVNFKLKEADSLFNRKLYTQSIKIYEELYEKDKVYSPEMLLKMGFIQEGLGNYTKALYFLNLSYSKTNDRKTRLKIEELAEKNKLEGYEYSDITFIYQLYKYYYRHIVLVFVITIALLMILVLIRVTRRKGEYKIPAALILGILLVVFVFHITVNKYSTAIVLETTHLMSGPSAGADVLEKVKKGNKVSIIGSEDVWLRITIDDKKGYIKKTSVLSI